MLCSKMIPKHISESQGHNRLVLFLDHWKCSSLTAKKDTGDGIFILPHGKTLLFSDCFDFFVNIYTSGLEKEKSVSQLLVVFENCVEFEYFQKFCTEKLKEPLIEEPALSPGDTSQTNNLYHSIKSKPIILSALEILFVNSESNSIFPLLQSGSTSKSQSILDISTIYQELDKTSPILKIFGEGSMLFENFAAEPPVEKDTKLHQYLFQFGYFLGDTSSPHANLFLFQTCKILQKLIIVDFYDLLLDFSANILAQRLTSIRGKNYFYFGLLYGTVVRAVEIYAPQTASTLRSKVYYYLDLIHTIVKFLWDKQKWIFTEEFYSQLCLTIDELKTLFRTKDIKSKQKELLNLIRSHVNTACNIIDHQQHDKNEQHFLVQVQESNYGEELLKTLLVSGDGFFNVEEFCMAESIQNNENNSNFSHPFVNFTNSSHFKPPYYALEIIRPGKQHSEQILVERNATVKDVMESVQCSSGIITAGDVILQHNMKIETLVMHVSGNSTFKTPRLSIHAEKDQKYL